ncbi:MAG: CYTH domain-containing protein [Flavobacteriales bacterium]|jgi:adenylate cyclase|tara:strand:- start:91 stop:555 length:465 start_codon:yes stop_codon:yes gene_type:complete
MIEMIEIERKFLVKAYDYRKEAHRKTKIIQGYLTKDPKRTVRVRIREDQGFLTIKGMSSENGLSRFEWEKEISLNEAQELITLCLPTVIEKTRYEVTYKGVLFEIDEFEGAHNGLVLVEVELNSTKDIFEIPKWVDKEVTGDKKYYNSYLSNSR